MIFVTVGGASFDKLVKEVDRLVAEGLIKEKVVMQIGNGEYIPKHCEWFKFADSLEKFEQNADLIISHEGAATLLEVIRLNKRIIVLTNPNTITNSDLVRKLSEEGYLLWCNNINELKDYIIKSKTFKPKKYKPEKCEIHNKIKEEILS